VHLTAELELHRPLQHDQKLLRVSVRVRLGSGRAALIELADEHLEVEKWPRRQQPLRAEDAERKGRTLLPAEDLRPWRTARVEEIGDAHTEGAGDAPQRGDARARATALDLAQEAFTDARAIGDRPKRRPAKAADVTEPLADVDFGGSFGRAGRNQISLDPAEGKLKRPYGVDEAVSTS
jgi:hypothetical protein